MDTAEYKAKKIVEAAEQKRAEAEEYSEALQQAEQSEIAHSKNGMRKQIVAVTADNADLIKRLDKVMQETLDIDKENKELKAYKVRAAKALALLARLERETRRLTTHFLKANKNRPYLHQRIGGQSNHYRRKTYRVNYAEKETTTQDRL